MAAKQDLEVCLCLPTHKLANYSWSATVATWPRRPAKHLEQAQLAPRLIKNSTVLYNTSTLCNSTSSTTSTSSTPLVLLLLGYDTGSTRLVLSV